MSAQPAQPPSALSCRRMSVAVGQRVLVRDLDIEFNTGCVTAILGCNGAGKTLTLHTLTGLRMPLSGEPCLGGQPISAWHRRSLARTLGLLTQTTEDAFPSTVLDAVLVGRHPHIGFWDWESNEDQAIAAAALGAVGLTGLEARDVATLSGGERRRVAIAALLAQDPDVYLLDEPINHLDPHHQIDVLQLLRAKAEQGRTIVMTLHDASLAARFSDHALLLFGNGEWLYGTTREILNETTMSRLYGLAVREVNWTGGRMFVMGANAE